MNHEKIKNIIVLSVGTILALLLLVTQQQRADDLQKIVDLEARIKALSDQLALSKIAPLREPAVSQMQNADEQNLVSSTNSTILSPPKPTESGSFLTDLLKSSTDMLVKAQIDQIEAYTKIDPDQRGKLEVLFKHEADLSEQLIHGKIDAHVVSQELLHKQEALEDILGKDVVDNMQALQTERRERQKEDDREKEILLLSRDLELSSDQQSKVREVLIAMDKSPSLYMQIPREKITDIKDFDFNKSMKFLQEMNQQRDTYLREQLKNSLSDAQFNKLLEHQALRKDRSIFPMP